MAALSISAALSIWRWRLSVSEEEAWFGLGGEMMSVTLALIFCKPLMIDLFLSPFIRVDGSDVSLSSNRPGFKVVLSLCNSLFVRS